MEERTELFGLDSASKFLKKNLLVVILILCGILLLIVGGLQFLSSNSSEGSIEFLSEEEKKPSKIFVDVGGAVKSPGVYEFEHGKRITDAIKSAGGLDDKADKDFIEQNLNLALTLSDGMKLYIPSEGEEYSGGSVLSGSTALTSDQVNLNSASQKELESLPRIGPVTAEKIISGRPYESVEDLLLRKIVGASVFEQIKDLITAP